MENEIYILVMQETELEPDFDNNLLNIPGYNFESENNMFKKRVGVYINSSIKYERCTVLEGLNSHTIIIDLISKNKNKKRMINIYRSFNPNEETAKELFVRQLEILKNAFNNNTVILGDLNLDYKTRFDLTYQRKNYFELFEEHLGRFNLLQLVTFDTWSRLVGLNLRSSILDHIFFFYVWP